MLSYGPGANPETTSTDAIPRHAELARVLAGHGGSYVPRFPPFTRPIKQLTPYLAPRMRTGYS